MISIEPFEPIHVASLALQAAQGGDTRALTMAPGAGAALGPAFSAIERVDGAEPRVLGCAGLVVNNPTYATAWAMFCEDKGAGMVAVTRAIQRVLAAAEYRRVDMMVRADFQRARDYAALLGFHREARLHLIGPDGSDFEIWARFKPRKDV